MNKRIMLIAFIAVILLASLVLLPVVQGEPGTQDATAQQQTVDAVVQERFTQTAAAQQQAAEIQAAQTQTAAAEPPSPATQTAAFEATVNAVFFQAMTATAQVEIMAAIEARGLEVITFDNLTRLESLSNLGDAGRNVVDLAFGPGGRLLVTGGLRGAVQLWDVATATQLRRFSGHSNDITAVAFNADGRLIASASTDGSVRLWDATSGAEVLNLPIGVVHALAFSPDGSKLATGDQNGMVSIWDVTTGSQLQAIAAPVGAVRALAFHPDSRQIALGGDAESVQIWDTSSGMIVYDLLYSAGITAVAFSPDGWWLVAASQNAPIRQWDTASGMEVWTTTISQDFGDALAFNPDGSLIIASSRESNKIAILDAASGNEVGSVRMSNPVNDIAFSPDGAVFVAASVGVRFWGVVFGSVGPAVATGSDPTAAPALPTLTPRPGATPRPEIFPTDVLAEVQIVEQVFEHGRMFWIRHNRQIWVMIENAAVPRGGDWYCYRDTFEDGEQETDPSLRPPDDLLQPRRGFGKLWRDNPVLKEGLGWGVTPEFDLVSYYTYVAGGYVQDGQYIAGPGEHRLTTLYGDSLSFFESEIRGDCLGGTWQDTSD